MNLVKILRIGGLAVIATLVLASLSLTGFVVMKRQGVKSSQQITTENGIDSLSAPMINGVSQWVQIRGDDRENPVIVFIHGGPANPMMPWAHIFQRRWESDFTVVQWDQRGAGKSRQDSKTGEPIPHGDDIEQYIDDALAVIAYVQEQTGQEKVIIMGHSWGSLLGLRIAQQRPDLLHAYVGTGQVLDLRAAEERVYDLVLAEAEKQENAEAIDALTAIQPYPEVYYGDGDIGTRTEAFLTSRYWVGALLPTGIPVTGQLLASPFLSPAYSLSDAWSFLQAIQDTSLTYSPLFQQVMASDFPDEGLTLQVPVIFIEGRHDHYTESSIVAERFPLISAPKTEFFWLEDSGHFGLIQEKEAFHALLVEHLLPLVGDGVSDQQNLSAE